MIKKEYMKPAMELLKTDTQEQLLTGSLNDVNATGLDDEIDINDSFIDIWSAL